VAFAAQTQAATVTNSYTVDKGSEVWQAYGGNFRGSFPRVVNGVAVAPKSILAKGGTPFQYIEYAGLLNWNVDWASLLQGGTREIVSATYKYYTYSYVATTPADTMTVARIGTATITAGGVTKPTFDTGDLFYPGTAVFTALQASSQFTVTGNTVVSTKGVLTTIDLTSYVQAWAADPTKALGIVLYGSSGANWGSWWDGSGTMVAPANNMAANLSIVLRDLPSSKGTLVLIQ
jgi:hypothetical protein